MYIARARWRAARALSCGSRSTPTTGSTGRAARSLMPAPPRSRAAWSGAASAARVLEHERAVLGARAVVGHRACPRSPARMPRRGRSRGSTAARPAPPRWPGPGSGWRRRRRARCGADAMTPSSRSSAKPTATLEMSSKRRFATLWNAVSPGERQRDAHRPDELVGAAHRLAVPREVVGEVDLALAVGRDEHDARLEGEQRRQRCRRWARPCRGCRRSSRGCG